MQASMALLSSTGGCFLAYNSRPGAPIPTPIGAKWWLAGGLLMLAVPLFTMTAIMPVNKRLMSREAEVVGDKALREDLETWGVLHSVRTLMGLGAVVCFFRALY